MITRNDFPINKINTNNEEVQVTLNNADLAFVRTIFAQRGTNTLRYCILVVLFEEEYQEALLTVFCHSFFCPVYFLHIAKE